MRCPLSLVALKQTLFDLFNAEAESVSCHEKSIETRAGHNFVNSLITKPTFSLTS